MPRSTQVLLGSFSVSDTGLSPPTARLSSRLLLPNHKIPHWSPTTPNGRIHSVWAIPRSLATTEGVSFDFLSSGY